MASNLQTLLNYILENTIEIPEAAVGGKQIKKEKFALYASPGGGIANFFLYSPGRLVESLQGDINEGPSGDVMQGAIALEWIGNCEAWEVTLSGAERGYGPFLYQSSSSILGWIMSDREDVSSQAKNIWKWMFSHPEQWEKSSLVVDKEQRCSQSSSVEETSDSMIKKHFLNYKYKWIGEKNIASNALKAHEQAILQIEKETGLKRDNIEFLLLEEAEAYLRK